MRRSSVAGLLALGALLVLVWVLFSGWRESRREEPSVPTPPKATFAEALPPEPPPSPVARQALSVTAEGGTAPPPATVSLSGTVRSDDGTPLEKQHVWLHDPAVAASAKRQVQTDDHGDYSIPDIEPGLYRVRIVSWQYEDAEETFRIEGDTRKDWILRPGLTITGIVQDLSGRPLDRVRVEVLRDDRREAALAYRALTDSEGFFMLRGLESGLYDIQVWLQRDFIDAGFASIGFGTHVAGSAGLVFQIPQAAGKGVLIVRASEADGGADLGGFEVFPFLDSDAIPGARSFSSTQSPRGQGRAGVCTLELPEATWRVGVSAEGFVPSHVGGVVVRQGLDTEIEVALARARSDR